MTVLLQMWVGRQRPRRQEFQMLSAQIWGGYVQATTYALIRSGQPKSRDLAVAQRLTVGVTHDETVRCDFGRPRRLEAAGGQWASSTCLFAVWERLNFENGIPYRFFHCRS
jgi:hypothetical protein